ncbi:MAG: helicase-exonuclease AddAB subunit AddA [Culicoidibacterales bacterium]
MKFTLAQQQAIDQQQTNILVAAAAGSGKTAVLVERIIQKILQRHCQIDELIVLTFTNAAAAEMRLRIRNRLEREVSVSRGEQALYLQQQLQLLNQAQISTFHAFCIQLLRQYYYAIDLDPQFRIGDEFELALLKVEAMETTLEQFYTENSSEFVTFIEAYSNDRGDDAVQSLIYQITNFKHSLVNPQAWEQQALANYTIQTDFLATPVGKMVQSRLTKQFEQWEQILVKALAEQDLTEKNAEKVQRIVETYRAAFANHAQVLKKGNWQQFSDGLCKIEVDRWPPKAAPLIKQSLDTLKKQWESIQTKYHVSAKTLSEQFGDIQQQVQQLFLLSEAYEDNFSRLKRQRNIVDFSDLERKTLILLQQESTIASEYQQRIQELLVDEYQDTNEVQETIVRFCSRGNNIFMVGDVKQSIYRFRSADPTLFQQKYQLYASDQQAGVRIDLNQNFRSREQVIDFINFVFEQIMDREFAEIAYDEQAKLYAGAAYPEHEHMQVELDCLALPDGEDKIENQAQYLVQRIQKLIASETLITTAAGSRPIRYADIAMLFRSRSDLFERVSELLKESQIPYVAQEQGGYFDASEIRNLLAILRIIDNPYDDIEYASWLRSPIIGLDENELLTVRLRAEGKSFCEAVQQFTEQDGDLILSQKLQQAKIYEQRWRIMAKQRSLVEWIEQVLLETGYYDFVGGLPNGIHRQANIDALIDKARTYETIGFRGLFKFNRFIVAMQKQNQDFTNSRSIAEQENVVQLMTIHKSKGLEFPVVIVAELEKQFNERDLHQTLVLDKEHGASLRYVNIERNYSVNSLMHVYIGEAIGQAQLAEELRILYVALTRAKEKLILVAQGKEREKLLERGSVVLSQGQQLLSQEVRQSAKSYFDWIWQAVIRHQSLSPFQSQFPVAPTLITQAPLALQVNYYEESFSQTIESRRDTAHFAEAIQQARLLDGELVPLVEKSLSFSYPNPEATRHYAQVSISDLKRFAQVQAQQEATTYSLQPGRGHSPMSAVLPLPNFMAESKQEHALQRGNAYHAAMQYLPQTVATEQDIQTYLATEKRLTIHQAFLESDWLVQFLRTKLGKQFQQAEFIQRELPFTMFQQTTDVYPNWEEPDQAVILRGIFDAIYHLETEIIIVDYKTDYVGQFDQQTQVQLRERYQLQMTTYLAAARKIFADSGKTIRGELYFFQAQQSLQF